MAVKAILWDVDGTLLDFSAAEKAALQATFSAFGLGTCTRYWICCNAGPRRDRRA